MILSGGVIDLRKAEPVKCMDFEFLKNYPKNGLTLFQDSWVLTTYHCIEKDETPDWQLIPDSTTTIIGYHCQLAKTNFKGRTWLAWYAEDIPVSEGPWKLCGLPGLILRAYDAQQQFYLNAIGLEDLNGKETLKYAKPEEAEKVSQSDLTKIKLRDDGSEMLRDENGQMRMENLSNQSKETCLQSNRAIRTSQRLSISDFCEFLQKSEIESLFSCSYRQFIVLLQKDF